MPKPEKAPVIFPKYYVLKIEDLENCLSAEQVQQLAAILECVGKTRREMGKNPNPTYHIVNTDEPYADKVQELILTEEAKYLD